MTTPAPRPSATHRPEPEPAIREYDYIVVGGGTAGSVVAARLSEDPDSQVLLVEAGAAEASPEMATPGIWPTLLGSAANWGDSTVVQEFPGTPMPAPRGRGLGGSSSINGLNFLRGHRSSYDAWHEQGAIGWGYDAMLQDFRRSETAAGRDAAVRGIDGPMVVGPTPSPSPVVMAALAAASEVGHRAVDDVSSGTEVGFGLSDANVVAGARVSAADAYLRPILHRANLEVVSGSQVRRLLIEDRVCVGIEHGGVVFGTTAIARREVILTAGAIGSAQLLMLSGVGPAEHLADMGIEVVLDLPGVGANLHDHPMSTIVFEHAAPLPGVPENIWGQGVGLLHSNDTVEHPDVQILLISQPYRAQGLPGPAPDGGYAIGFAAMLPHSRGSVRLASREATTAPLIDPNYLGDVRDQQVMVDGFRAARRIGAARALAPWRGDEAQPGRSLERDEDVVAYLRESLVVYFHHAGTCRMGVDDLAVVDPDLRVRGIAGLRVADASVMPSPVSANTNATVLAIAERAARLVMA